VEDPTVTVAIELPDLVRLSGGELDPVEALMDGLIEVRGDILTAARLGEMFGAIPDLVVPDAEPPR
jgi:putative sterol carrier protein